MKTWQSILFGLLCGLLASAMILLVAAEPKGEPIRLLPAATSEPITVYLTGAVTNPGVYVLPPASRVHDLIDAAGGLAASANSTAVNLAARLVDGQQVVVPEVGQEVLLAPVTAGPQIAAAIDEKININTADAKTLEELPGIGPTRAEAIVAYRTEHGPFQQIEDLLDVPGIGPATLEQMRDHVTR